MICHLPCLGEFNGFVLVKTMKNGDLDGFIGIFWFIWIGITGSFSTNGSKFITAGKIIELVLGDMINGPNVG